MSLPAYALSLVLLSATLVPVAAAARSLRRAVLPAWSGAPAWTADAVAAIALIVVVCEVLGVIGAFRAGWIAAGSIATAAAVSVACRRWARSHAKPGEAPPRGGRLQVPALALSLGAAALVFGQWAAATRTSLDQGMATTDTLWYHMPFAAGFVQNASLTNLHFVELQASTAYYPQNSELLHGLAIALFSSHDVLSPSLNLGFLGLALLAGWCIGRPFGISPITMLAVAVAAAAPILWANNAGQAGNDVAGLSFFLCAIALVVNARNRGPALLFAAAATGLAVGTKLTLIAPALALVLVSTALAAGPRARVRQAGGWALAGALTGGFWYARNLIATGSPAPWFSVHVGPIGWSAPPRPLNDRLEFSVAHYLTDSSIWHGYLLPGLKWGLGWGWPLVLVLAAAGAVGAVLTRGDPLRRGLGVVAIVSALAYLVTPNGAAGHEGVPWSFGLNLRYAVPAIALGLTLLPLSLGARPGRRRHAIQAALSGAVLLTLGVPTALWHPRGAMIALSLAIAGAAMVLLWLVTAGRRHSAVFAAGIAFVLAAVLVFGWLVQRHYLRARYAPGSFNTPVAFGFARDLERTRIAMYGSLVAYQLYGRNLSNRVTYVGRRGSHGAFTEITSCAAWRDALNRGRYRYVVVAPVVSPNLPWGVSAVAPPQLAWTRDDPAAHPLTPPGAWGVYRITAPLSPRACTVQ